MQLYKEGKAAITAGKGVFLNQEMSKLRDISVMFLNAAATKENSLLDSTAATGIRGIRYSLECGIKKVTLLEINPDAAKAMKANLKRNRVKATALTTSIQEFASTSSDAIDIIDLDPFGSPVPHIHDLLKISHGETIFMVTATDTAVLCGAHQSACIKMYNAKPLHNDMCKEAGIRILLGFITRNASQFNFGIVPMLSISDMHYMRVFVKLQRSAKDAVDSMKELGYVASCNSCHAFEIRKGIVPEISSRCKNCNSMRELAGPMWLGKLQDKDILSKMLKQKGKDMADAKAMTEKIHSEPDIPFLYSIPSITKSLSIGSVSPLKVIESLRKKGYAASSTQFAKDAIKTDADQSVLVRTVKEARKAL